MRIAIKGTTLIYCPFCKSPWVEHDEPQVEETPMLRHERYNVRCTKCGSKGRLWEHWYKDGDTNG